MLEMKENKVKIEGILSEVDLQKKVFKKNGQDTNAIGGVIKIRVDQEINGVMQNLEVPVHMFASQFTNKGTPNPAYDSIEKIMTEYTSIAASDINSADRVRITNGTITMNEYYGQNGNLVSFPRIQASFVSKIDKATCKPEATFAATFMVGNLGYELDKDGVETDRFKITGFLPQYGGKVDVVTFYAVNKGVIDAVSQYWNEKDTVKASGKLNFTSTTIEEKVEQDFGDPQVRTRTISVSDLIITGGSSAPMEGDFAISYEDVCAALEKRKAALEELKSKKAAKPATQPAKSGAFANLGF